MGAVVDEVAIGPDACVYGEGWQSWSPTAWWRGPFAADRPAEGWQHLMRFRPGTAVAEDAVQGEGLLIVDPGGGRPAVRFAIDEAGSEVATIVARPLGGVLRVAADGPVTRTEHASGPGALASFGEAFGAASGVQMRPAPRVWCSWYRYFEGVTASDIDENVAVIEALGLGVDVIQIDDGWGTPFGEGALVRPGFGSLARVVGRIRDGGREAGLWLAPFVVGTRSTLAREYSDWFVGPAGRNWGDDLVGLDLTHPGVRERVAEVVARARALGVTYLKLDFLYAGALPGPRHDGSTPVEAYRSGLRLIREAAGPVTFLLGCGAPILPSVGLMDAMRVSPDIFHEGGEDGSDGLRGARSLVARAWQHGRFWLNDPDCLVMRPSYPLRDAWADAVREHGGMRTFSDRIAELDAHGLAVTRAYLESAQPARLPG